MQDKALGVQYFQNPNMSEDCFYLNVWTGAKGPNEKLSVLVWIHGGGFAGGSPSIPACFGTSFAKKGMVYVCAAYRVGPMGFLAHPELSQESGRGSVVNGIQDQIAGLKWVKENIAQFGGDPDNVTIFGESAGGFSVSILSIAPEAKGLFHRMICQSGVYLTPLKYGNEAGTKNFSLPLAEKDGKEMLTKLGADNIMAARALSAEVIQNAVPSFDTFPFWPVADGSTIPDDAYEMYQQGKFHDVPALVGFNSDEGAFFVRPERGLGSAGFAQSIRNDYGPAADSILKTYPHATDAESFRSQKDIVRDTMFGWPSWAIANLHFQRSKHGTFVYYFDCHDEKSPDGATHGAEVPFVLLLKGGISGGRPSAADIAMMDLISAQTITWSAGSELLPPANAETHTWRLCAASATALEFSCAFSAVHSESSVPDFPTTSQACASHWKGFWENGGAVDLSGSTDPRWHELERRIVLSQYLMAAQSAGSLPPAEAGLMDIDPWRGQFHMEMVWWHLAHYALWDRWALADRTLGIYELLTPAARDLSEQLGYKGLKWPKCVRPEGRTAPWPGNQVLLWKQPHPLFFAELDYRLHPTRATLEKWSALVEGTAEHMADYPMRDEETGIYHLEPVMPPSELGVTRDTVFDLAYWRWGLERAQVWRVRLGLPRNPQWDAIWQNLAPLPVHDGLYVHSADWLDTYTKRAWEHPDPIGVFGMLPATEGVDRETARRTVLKVWTTWDWTRRCWGWDFPWMAMAAARVGEPGLAVDALLRDAGTRNNYDQRGVCTGGPCPYLPGNGGLLYAVAMMAAGWDGAPKNERTRFPR